MTIEAGMVFKDDKIMDDGAIGTEAIRSKKRLAWFAACAKNIDESVGFHALYGALDGISVSYSTVKFLCDVTANSTKEYHQHLNTLLTDPGMWLPVLLLESVMITGLSLLGNAAAKDQKINHSLTAFARDNWPYIRDILKGVKNGYKGIKGLTGILTSLDLVAKENFRALALPVGLVLGSIGMLNRLYNRQANSTRKDLKDKQKKVFAKIKALNTFLQDKQDLKLKIDDVDDELTSCLTTEIESLKYRRKQLKAELSKLVSSHENLEVEWGLSANEVIQAQKSIASELSAFEKSHSSRLFCSNIIGGIVDGPYLYAGVLGLTKLTGTWLLFSAVAISVFMVAVVFVRAYEECEKQRSSQRAMLESELAFRSNQLIKAQNNFYKWYRQHPDASKEQVNAEYTKLKKQFFQIRETKNALKEVLIPTYLSAVSGGLLDGLSAFGALSSIYFAVAIGYLFMGATFPPALLVAGILFGLASIIGFTIYRLHKTYHIRQHHQDFFEMEKEREERELTFEPNGLLLKAVDWNTDGLTKGEFYFQQIFEVFRCVGSGPYKGKNLMIYLLSRLEEHDADGTPHDTPFMLLFMAGVSIVYALCLMLRAIGRGFSHLANSDKTRGVEQGWETQKTQIDGCSAADGSGAIASKFSSNSTHQPLASSNRFGFFKSRTKETETDIEQYGMDFNL